MNGTLENGEPHPADYAARDYLSTIPFKNLCLYRETFASLSIEGNKLAEICSETLRRLMNSEPVSDRYLLGLAWTIKDLEEN